MNGHINIESLDMLIKAVNEYQTELSYNKQILLNAAIVCDAAMGSDDLAKKHIAKLNDALEELQKTAQVVSNVVEALIEDRRNAIAVYEGI